MAEGPQGVAKAPVPPCIMAVDGNTTQISLEVDDRSAHLSMPSATSNVQNACGCLSYTRQ